jgi:flagellar basal-body rod protein FlgF
LPKDQRQGFSLHTGYYSTAGAMVTQFSQFHSIAGNLAKKLVSASKRDGTVIGNFTRIYQEQRDILPLPNHTKEASKFLNRSLTRVPQIVEQYTDQRVGTMKETGNPLDFALQKEGHYFAVETPQGIRYTRNGSFSIGHDGKLVTKTGYPVLSRDYFSNQKSYIQIPSNAEEATLTVDKDGNLYQDGALISSLAIIQHDNVKYLKNEGGSLLKTLREEEYTVLENSQSVVNGFLEQSNIDPVTEMVGLIETHRLIDQYSKVMKSHMDDLNSDAIHKLAKTKA